MAQTTVTHDKKALQCLVTVCVLLLIQKGTAFEFRVGGSRGIWAVPNDPNAAIYNQWAEKNRFQIGDTLLFVYDGAHDSVLRVSKDDYTSCNTEAPIERLSDGHSVFKLGQSGPYYFISGVADNCRKNEKMVVIVLADRGSNHNSPSSTSPPNLSAASSILLFVVGSIAAFVA